MLAGFVQGGALRQIGAKAMRVAASVLKS